MSTQIPSEFVTEPNTTQRLVFHARHKFQARLSQNLNTTLGLVVYDEVTDSKWDCHRIKCNQEVGASTMKSPTVLSEVVTEPKRKDLEIVKETQCLRQQSVTGSKWGCHRTKSFFSKQIQNIYSIFFFKSSMGDWSNYPLPNWMWITCDFTEAPTYRLDMILWQPHLESVTSLVNHQPQSCI